MTTLNGAPLCPVLEDGSVLADAVDVAKSTVSAYYKNMKKENILILVPCQPLNRLHYTTYFSPENVIIVSESSRSFKCVQQTEWYFLFILFSPSGTSSDKRALSYLSLNSQ